MLLYGCTLINAWTNAKNKCKILIYEKFIANFPNSRYTQEAIANLTILKDWERTKESNKYSDYKNFKNKYQNLDLADSA